MTRQKITGWILVAVSSAYLIYFLKVRLFETGPYIDRHEWLRVLGAAVCLFLGVMNVRLAARTERQRAARLAAPRESQDHR